MKTVYEIFFRKPFSKTREAFCSLPLLSFSALSTLSALCYLSLLSLLSFSASPISFVFLCSLDPIHFVEAESGTDTESFKIDAGAACTDRRRPRSGPDEAGENILTPIVLFLCSLSLLICGGRWWVAGWVAVAGRGEFQGGFGWLAVVSVWV
uniref:Transmembrane protein n=1 Tax=Fagus sylvatica TaxID=28930 RepID=A0A2N9F219_FAGSY